MITRQEANVRQQQLAQYRPTTPDVFPELPTSKLSMVQRLLGYVIEVFNKSPENRAMATSYDRVTSVHGKKDFDKAIFAQQVKELAANNGDDPVVANTTLADIARAVTWCLRKGEQAPSQIAKAARHAQLTASQPAE